MGFNEISLLVKKKNISRTKEIQQKVLPKKKQQKDYILDQLMPILKPIIKL